MIYLFSSTSRDQYRQDVLNVLALPAGGNYHFRYDKKWVSDDVFRNFARYQGEMALVVCVILPPAPAQGAPAPPLFYPLREACTLRLEIDGTILHAYFELGRFVQWPQGGAQGYPLSTPDPPLTFPPAMFLSAAQGKEFTPDIAYATDTTTADAWEAIVTRISPLPDFAQTIFYRVTGLRQVHSSGRRGGPVQLQDVPLQRIMPADTDNNMGYDLRGSHMYTLDLSFYHNEEVSSTVKGNAVGVDIDKTYFVYTPRPIDILFAYDRRAVELVPAARTTDIFTRLNVSAQVPGGGSAQLAYAPVVSLPLRLTYNRVRQWIGLGVLIVAQFLSTATNIKAVQVAAGPHAPPLIGGLCAFLITVGPIVGPVMTAVAIFILVGKLPGA